MSWLRKGIVTVVRGSSIATFTLTEKDAARISATNLFASRKMPSRISATLARANNPLCMKAMCR